MLDTDTKRRIDTARDILVGKVPDPKSQVEQITIALIYKFMDDMDAEAEELGGLRKFFAGDFARYGWAKLMRSGKGLADFDDLAAGLGRAEIDRRAHGHGAHVPGLIDTAVHGLVGRAARICAVATRPLLADAAEQGTAQRRNRVGGHRGTGNVAAPAGHFRCPAPGSRTDVPRLQGLPVDTLPASA